MTGSAHKDSDPTPSNPPRRGDPLRVQIGGLSLEAEYFEERGRHGWFINRQALFGQEAESLLVEIEVRVLDSGATLDSPPQPWLGCEEDLLEALSKAPLQRAEFNKGGSSVSFRLDLEGGRRALFRPEQINPQTMPRKEVAAYRLGRRLGLDAVPPVTFRSIGRDELLGRLAPDARVLLPRIDAETCWDDRRSTLGSLAVWVPRVVDSRLDTLSQIRIWSESLGVAGVIPEGKRELYAQLSSMLLFDLLINNEDRFTGGNLLISPDGRTLYFMDNSFSFAADPEGHPRCRAFLARAQRFSVRLVSTLRGLDAQAIRAALEHEPALLFEEEMAALLGRRETALRILDELCRRYGEERVLTLP
jgi:hypothetical protein